MPGLNGPFTPVDAPPLRAPLTGLLQAVPVIEVGSDAIVDPDPQQAHASNGVVDGHGTVAVQKRSRADRFLGGIVFSPEGAVLPDLWDPCSPVGATTAPTGLGSRRPARSYQAIPIEVPDACSTFGYPIADYQARATRALEARESWALEREFESPSLITGNYKLADPSASIIGPVAGANPRDALALLDEAIASSGIGLGLIHCTPYVASLWANVKLINFNEPAPDGYPVQEDGIGGRSQGYVTSPKGNIVVIGNGYRGIGPDGTGGVPTAQTFYDGVTTEGNTTFTSGSAVFTSADTGRVVSIVGGSGTGAPFVTTMTYVNATTVTLAAAPTASGSGLPFSIAGRTGDSTHGIQWAYATDLVSIYRDRDVKVYPDTMLEATDRANNNVVFRATRGYAVAWSGLLLSAVRVSTALLTGTGDSPPVAVTNVPTVNIGDPNTPANKAAVNASGQLLVNATITSSNTTTRTAETSTVLLAGATRNGTAQASNGYAKFRGFAASDVAGTLNIQQSRDGATWFTTATQAVAAGFATGTVVESLVTLGNVRVQYVNGATNQASFEFDSELVAI